MTTFKKRNILGMRQMTKEEISFVLDTAESLREILQRPIKKVPTLRGRTVVNLFFEPSTRTKLSFELAAKRLSADTVSISASASSVVKGETLVDTARNIEAMKPDIIVMRHPLSGAPHLLVRHISTPVINAGDGTNEHPSQALLDLMTARERLGDLKGARVAIVGDIAHSRVAHSDILGFSAMGASVVVCGPATMLPPMAQGVETVLRLSEAIQGADIVIALRIQKERQGRMLVPSLREYASHFGLSPRVLEEARPGALIMHPGPMNRGVEITDEVADGPNSVILDQVTNGVAVRMALLTLLTGDQSGE